MDNKQLITTVALFAMIMVGFYFFFGRGGSSSAAKVETPPEFRVDMRSPGKPEKEPEVKQIGSIDPKSGYKMAVVITEAFAGVEHVDLADWYADYRRREPFRILETEEDASTAPARKVLPPFATLWAEVHLKDSAEKPTRYNLRWALDQAHTNETQVTLTTDVPDGAGNEIKIVKTYRLEKGGYDLQIAHQIINGTPADKGGKSVEVRLAQLGPTNLPSDSLQMDMRSYRDLVYNPTSTRLEKPADSWLSKYVDGSTDATVFGQAALESTWASMSGLQQELRTAAPDKQAGIQKQIEDKTKDTLIGDFSAANPLVWFAASDRYFAAIVRAMPVGTRDVTPTNTVGKIAISDQFGEVRVVPLAEKILATEITTKALLIPAGTSTEFGLNTFLGPKKASLLKGNYRNKPKEGEEPLPEWVYAVYQYSDVIQYSQGGCYAMCTITLLADGLLGALHGIKYLVHNYGVAIIILVIVVRLLMHPLTRYSQVNMANMQRKMAKIQPEIERVKKKYEKDKARQQQELMAVYKEHKINPAGGIMGCLPMLIQIPIWAALWGGLATDFNLRQAAFIPGWINDLANPDMVWPRSMPVVGVPWKTVPIVHMDIYGLNLLPLLLGVVFFVQMRVQMKIMPKPADDQQAKTQKWSQYMMLIFPLFLYNAPSGLNLYIFASTIGGLIDSWLVRRHMRAQGMLDQPAK